MARLSGLQREVLSLYRQCLREVRKKPIVRGLFLFYARLYELFQPQISSQPPISISSNIIHFIFFHRTPSRISKTMPGMSSTLQSSFPSV